MSAAPAKGRPHRRLVKALVVVASLLSVFAIFAVWAEREALDTDDWVQTSGRLLENEDIRRIERLERLAALHERGALSDEEFEAEKAAVRSGETGGS
jgi:hypothetical protein